LTDRKKSADNLFPWEEEEKKKEPQSIGGIPSNTNISSKVHSKPNSKGQEYLDMYIMNKEQERLEKYGQILGKQQKNVAASWGKIKKRINETEKKISKNNKVKIKKSKDDLEIENKQNTKVPKHIKGMDWNY